MELEKENIELIVQKEVKNQLLPAAFKTKYAAEYLGIGSTTFNNWRNKGIVRPIFIDGMPLYRRSDLDNLLKGGE